MGDDARAPRGGPFRMQLGVSGGLTLLCDRAQGFRFHRPMPAEDLVGLIQPVRETT